MLMMLPYLIATKSLRKIERRDWPRFSVYIGLTIATQAPLYYAFNNASIGVVQLIFYATMLITTYAFARWYVGEHISRIKLIAAICAFAGLVLVFGTSVLVFSPLGLALAFANGFASGGEMTSTKVIPHKYSPALIAWYGWVFILLTHLPLSLVFENQVPFHLNKAWLWLAVYAVVNMLAFWLGLIGYKLVDASIASLIGLLEIIFAIIFGAVIFHEGLSWPVYVGGAVVIVAAMLPDVVRILDNRRSSVRTS